MKHLLIVFTTLLTILLGSCMSEEDYSISSADLLTFSTDTLAFDTIISGQPTNTYTLQAYNRNKQNLRITRAYLAKGSSSLFRVNIDGTFLQNGVAEELEVAKADSVRIFVEMTAPITGKDTPQKHEDKLMLRLESGIEQEIVLTASGQDVEVLKGMIVRSNTTLAAQRPYQIIDSLVVAEGTTLTVAPGVRFYFHAGASLVVHGTLSAVGTLTQPIEMRGDRLGYMFSNQPYDRIPNQWGGIRFTAKSTNNHLDFCDIHSGAFGVRCDSSLVGGRKILIENSVIHNVGGDGFSATMCKTEVGNSQITNAAGDCVKLTGGDHRFVHCTLAQFYPFAGERGVALRFTNHQSESRRPLQQATFINSLITGYSNDDIVGDKSSRHLDVPFNFLFQNCLLNTPKVTTPEQVKQCFFESDSPEESRGSKNFSPAFDNKRLIYLFTLAPISTAVDKGDLDIARTTYPTDRLGRSRTADGKPDLGCHEAQPSLTP